MLKLLIESISMGRGLYGSSTSLLGSSSDHYGHCCPPVFDASTIAALIGGIALATFFLRLVIVTTVFGGRRSLGSNIPNSKFGFLVTFLGKNFK